MKLAYGRRFVDNHYLYVVSVTEGNERGEERGEEGGVVVCKKGRP